MGSDSNSVVQILDDVNKSAGDRIRVILRLQLAGQGIQGDNTLVGNEEALSTYTDDVFIDQLRHAVRSGGKMTEQRIPFEIREEARLGLQDWWAARIDTWFMNILAGNSAQTDTKYTGNQAATAPSSSRVIFANGHAAESTLTGTASAVFSLQLVDAAALVARTATPVIRPVSTETGDKYVLFITPEQHYDLRRNTNTLQWGDIQKAAMQGGQISDNPIFTGALGEYNGVVLQESYRLPVIATGGASSTGRAVLCGAQAGLFAFGCDNSPNRMSWVEELFDFGNQFGVAAGAICGMKKTLFNSVDFGTVQISAAHSSDAKTLTGR